MHQRLKRRVQIPTLVLERTQQGMHRSQQERQHSLQALGRTRLGRGHTRLGRGHSQRAHARSLLALVHNPLALVRTPLVLAHTPLALVHTPLVLVRSQRARIHLAGTRLRVVRRTHCQRVTLVDHRWEEGRGRARWRRRGMGTTQHLDRRRCGQDVNDEGWGGVGGGQRNMRT